MDIFDVIAPEKEELPDADILSEDADDQDLKNKIATIERALIDKDLKRQEQNKKLTSEIKKYIEDQVSKVRMSQNVIERVIEKSVPVDRAVPVIQPMKETIREIIKEKPIYKTVEVITKEIDQTQIKALRKEADELRKQIADLRGELDKTNEILPMLGGHGGSGVIGIPAPEGNENKVLTVKGGKASWQTAASGSGGGSSTDAYVASFVTTTRSYNATSTSLDELASVVGSLIQSLQGAGIIQ